MVDLYRQHGLPPKMPFGAAGLVQRSRLRHIGVEHDGRYGDGAPEPQGAAMKVTVEIDCTPAEARAFFGLPDVTQLNDHLVDEMTKRVDANINMLQPEELLKNWMNFGGQAQETFMRLMTAAAGGTSSGSGRG
jgi:hypothetical protein